MISWFTILAASFSTLMGSFWPFLGIVVENDTGVFRYICDTRLIAYCALGCAVPKVFCSQVDHSGFNCFIVFHIRLWQIGVNGTQYLTLLSITCKRIASIVPNDTYTFSECSSAFCRWHCCCVCTWAAHSLRLCVDLRPRLNYRRCHCCTVPFQYFAVLVQFNPAKTNVLFNANQPILIFKNMQLNFFSHEIYLRVTLSYDGTWRDHITNITTYVSKVLGSIRML